MIIYLTLLSLLLIEFIPVVHHDIRRRFTEKSGCSLLARPHKLRRAFLFPLKSRHWDMYSTHGVAFCKPTVMHDGPHFAAAQHTEYFQPQYRRVLFRCCDNVCRDVAGVFAKEVHVSLVLVLNRNQRSHFRIRATRRAATMSRKSIESKVFLMSSRDPVFVERNISMKLSVAPPTARQSLRFSIRGPQSEIDSGIVAASLRGLTVFELAFCVTAPSRGPCP